MRSSPSKHLAYKLHFYISMKSLRFFMVIFQKIPSHFCRFFSLVAVIFICCFSFFALAEKNKEAYAIEALRGLPAYFQFLLNQPGFVQQLSPIERQMAESVMHLLRKYEHDRLPPEGGRILPHPIEILFSNDQNQFQRYPGDTIRSATTTSGYGDPILFNLQNLNSPKIRFLDVIQIMIHEIGHKLGKNEDQGAMDTLAAKVRSYLEGFYFEKNFDDGISIQILSVPAENQLFVNSGAGSLRKIHFFVERDHDLQKLDFDLRFKLRNFHTFPLYTPPHNGGGNSLTSETLIVRDIIAESKNPFKMELIVERQNRWMYLDPNASVSWQPIDENGRRWGYPQFNQFDLIQPEITILKIPIHIYENLNDQLMINDTPWPLIPWNYLPYTRVDLQQLSQELHEEPENFVLKVKFQSPFPTDINSLSLEVTSSETAHSEYSYLARGELVDKDTYSFKIPRNLVPHFGGSLKNFVINELYEFPLNEVVSLPAKSSPHTNPNVPKGPYLSAQPLSIINGSQVIPYQANKHIVIDQLPFGLSIPVNFSPVQMRVRWVTDFSIYLNPDDEARVQSKNNDKNIFVGRLSKVQEEWIDPSRFSIETTPQGDHVLKIMSMGGSPTSTPFSLTYPNQFSQKDEGDREIKEIILISDDGRMIRNFFPLDRGVSKKRILKIPIATSCKSALHTP